MATLRANLHDSSSVEFDMVGGRRCRQTFLVQGLDRSEPALTLTRAASVAGLPGLGDLYPGEAPISDFDGMRCKRIWVGKSNGLYAWAYCDYDTQIGALVGYYTTNRTSRAYSTTVKSLPDGTLIKTGIITVPAKTITTSAGNVSIPAWECPAQVVSIPVRKALKVIEITGYGLGDLPANVLDAHLTVNDAPWQGLPAGYWLCTAQQTVESNDAGQRRVYIAFEAQGDVPWTVHGFAVDRATGLTARDATAMPTTYTAGVNPSAGAVSVGYYATRDFSSVFSSFLL